MFITSFDVVFVFPINQSMPCSKSGSTFYFHFLHVGIVMYITGVKCGLLLYIPLVRFS